MRDPSPMRGLEDARDLPAEVADLREREPPGPLDPRRQRLALAARGVLAIASRYIQSDDVARAAYLGRRVRHGIRFLSADGVREFLSGEFPDDHLTQHELASCFPHHGTLAQGE